MAQSAFPSAVPLRSLRLAPIAAACLALMLVACAQKDPAALLASAKTYLAKGDRKAAVIEIKNAIQADPQSAEARYLLGSALLDGGDPAQADVELRKALRLGHPSDIVLPKLAADLMARGQSRQLIDEFGATRLDSASARAALATSIASAHASLGDVVKAGDALAAALTADPSYTPALLSRARLLIAEKDLPGASGIADGLIRSAPQNPESWKLKGDIEQLGAGDANAAIVSYRKALDARPDFAPARLAMVQLYLQRRQLAEAEKELAPLKATAAGDPQVRYMAALTAFMNKDLRAAQDQASQLLKAAPNNVQVLLLAASIELDAKSTALAQAHLSRALELMPENAAARRLSMMAFLRAGQPEQAVAVLRRGHADRPIDPSLYTLAGDAYLQSGDAKTAQSFFEKASQLDPKDARKRTSLAIARLSGGDTQSGLLELQEVAASDKDTSADVALISAYLSQQQLDKAMLAIDALDRKQPNQPVAPYLRGRVQLSRHDAPAARASFAQALAVAPAYFPAAASLTALDLADNRIADAKARLVQFLVKEPNHSQALMALAEVEAKAGASRQETAATIGRAIQANPTDSSARLMLVEFHLRSGDTKQAIATAQSAVTAMPDDASMRDVLGQAQLKAGDVNQAVASFRKAAEMQPGTGRPYVRLASAQMSAKETAEAEQSLLRALSIQPDLVDAQLALASLYLGTGKVPAALKVARTMQTQRPREGIGYMLEGDIAAFAKDSAGAEASYRAGLKQAPSSELAIKVHGLLAASKGPVEANQFASQWQKQHPRDATFVFYLGDVALNRKDLVTAQARYREVVAIAPESAPALNNLAWLASELHQPDAIALAEKANRLAPGRASFMDTLATALAASKRFDEAIKVQKDALALLPDEPNLRISLARLYVKAGDKPNARITLDPLVALGPKYPAQAEVSKMLREL